MKWLLITIVAATALATLAWLDRDRWIASHPIIDPMVLFTAMPGTPTVQRDPSTLDPRYFDHLGYLVAGSNRIAMAQSSKRPSNPDNPYDMDLVVRVNALSTDGAARQALAHETETDAHLLRQKRSLVKADELSGDAAVARCDIVANAPVSCVITVRHGNYLLRYIGVMDVNGFFPSERDFRTEVGRIDAHVVAALRRTR